MDLFSEMGDMFSKLQKFHDAGEEPNTNNVEYFGTPKYSLYTAQDIIDLHQRIDITDDQGNLKYYTKSAIISLTSATDIMDAGDNVIAHLERELFSFTEKYYITMADGRKFTMTNELFHIVDDITNIEELGWQLQGNFVGLNFNLRDEFGEPIATIGKKMISLHDKYCIDLYKTEQEPVVVAILIVLEKMMQARSESSGSGASSMDD